MTFSITAPAHPHATGVDVYPCNLHEAFSTSLPLLIVRNGFRISAPAQCTSVRYFRVVLYITDLLIRTYTTLIRTSNDFVYVSNVVYCPSPSYLIVISMSKFDKKRKVQVL